MYCNFFSCSLLRLNVLVRCLEIHESESVQIFYIGSYESECASFYMHEFMKEQSVESVGKFHEVYILDLRCVAPEKLWPLPRLPASEV